MFGLLNLFGGDPLPFLIGLVLFFNQILRTLFPDIFNPPQTMM